MSAVENTNAAAQTGWRPKRGVPAGLWLRCDGCGATVFRKQVEQNLNVCPECGHHFYVPTAMRIRQLLDPDSFEEWYPDMTSGDPLGFSDRKPYRERVVEEQKKTGMKDACTVGRGYMRGRPLVFGMTDSAFIMGSMGSVVGEKLTRAVERATELSLPLVIVSGSGGGARMDEGIISLMQTGKVKKASVTCTGGLYGVDKESGKTITIDSWANEVHYLIYEDGAWRFLGNKGGITESVPPSSAPHHPLF